LKKKLRVNADPNMDSGDSHAPVPFYVTTRGYGVLVDTSRYTTFYCGNKKRKSGGPAATATPAGTVVSENALPAAYNRYNFGEPSEVMVEIPEAQGVDVYIFAGPTMRDAVQRYNLFSGGGALPPRWGLGVWYRAEKDFSQDDVLLLTSEFRERNIPCDVIGLEPGWQTHSYSCSYVWSDKFPQAAEFTRELAARHFRVNLWEHAFTHPTSPIYKALLPHSGDYEVWGGVVPDFLTQQARDIFANYHEKEHVAIGISGYKLDECDNSDFTGNWSFPELSAFPSGADGEQMHCQLGLRYQDTIQGIFDKRNTRTYGLVRSSHALAAPYPYVLYSDLYDHSEFIRAVAKMGLSGILWTPELRDATSQDDLIRRLQAVALSPMALINAWYIKNPPWKQIKREANNRGELDPNWQKMEALCRDILQLRMRFVPYLHAAFVRYQREGLPPFRPLVMDYPDDPKTWPVDDQYIMGDSVLVAPITAGRTERDIYLPAGDWYDFWTRKAVPGRQTLRIEVPIDQIPVYVKSGALLLLAEPAPHTDHPDAARMTAVLYGTASATATLYEEDGSATPSLTEVNVSWAGSAATGTIARRGEPKKPGYQVIRWIRA
jgi:alpha-D-xyloside xylohydrolase